MKLTFSRVHKSITFFPPVDLPNFVVITWVNGAGKSHLLEAIQNGSIQLDNIALDQTEPVRLFNWANLIPPDSGAFAPYQIAQERDELWNQFSQAIQSFRPQIWNSLQHWNHLIRFTNSNIHTLIELSEENLIETGVELNQAGQIIQEIKSVILSINQNLINNYFGQDYARNQLSTALQEKAGIPLIAFEKDDFYEYLPASWIPVDMFQQSFGRLFVNYQRNWRTNQLKELASSRGESVKFLEDKEFLAKHGESPWDFVNSILKTANLDFRINEPSKYEELSYEPILTEQVRGTQVKFSDLSSGERVLMSFALCLYYAEDRRQLVDYPKVLLFDEIDAPLHPSMSQSILHTIQEVLINRHEIKVILTTHSPSTVALAPEASLHVMNKTGEQRVQKTTKDKALAILTTGVPTLSINYENRRQVFVESQNDVHFYEQIYNQLRDHLVPEISLNFISSGVGGKGNCDQVREVVNQLSQAGDRTVYGIIDWDSRNNDSERVKVLGSGHRYSIENYIFDPILLAAFLLREKWIERSQVGLTEGEIYVDIAKFDNTRLQIIADFVVSKVSIHTSQNEAGEVSCNYVGGQEIILPRWFLQVQGHQLEQTLKEVFPQLKRFQQEPELKREILRKVVDDIPKLIPKDFMLLFQSIQNVD